MFVPHSKPTTLIKRVAVVALFAAVIGSAAVAEHVPGAAPMAPGHNAVLVLPIMNPDRGKRQFVDKGRIVRLGRLVLKTSGCCIGFQQIVTNRE